MGSHAAPLQTTHAMPHTLATSPCPVKHAVGARCSVSLVASGFLPVIRYDRYMLSQTGALLALPARSRGWLVLFCALPPFVLILALFAGMPMDTQE